MRPTKNNGAERVIRPSTVFGNVTAGFRTHCGSNLYAYVCSTVNVSRRQDLLALQAIKTTLNPGVGGN